MIRRAACNAPLRPLPKRSQLSIRHLHQFLKRSSPARPSLHSIHQPSFQQRHASSFATRFRTVFRKNPFSVSLALFFISAGVVGLGYVNYYYMVYIVRQYHNYPEPVAQKLRRAVYYTQTDLNPEEANKYYRQALEVANEVGMDPFSDEVLGIKLQVAFLMEKCNQAHRAVEVLERVRDDNLKWLERFGTAEEVDQKKRSRILGQAVAISFKVGNLYAHPAVYDRTMAEERLVWAVETSLKELQRRTNEHITDEDAGPWLTRDQIGAQVESLAHHYESQDKHYLATPLFLQALTMYPTQDCHSVVLMNNVASSLAQQSPRAARAVQAYAESRNINERPVGPLVSKQEMVQNAISWAQKALDVARGIQPPQRNDECDMACAVATHNLGEFAEMNRDFAEAQKQYAEAISIARAIGFEEGVQNSSARLKLLTKKT